MILWRATKFKAKALAHRRWLAGLVTAGLVGRIWSDRVSHLFAVPNIKAIMSYYLRLLRFVLRHRGVLRSKLVRGRLRFRLRWTRCFLFGARVAAIVTAEHVAPQIAD